MHAYFDVHMPVKQMLLNFLALSSFAFSMTHCCFFLFVELLLTFWTTFFFFGHETLAHGAA